MDKLTTSTFFIDLLFYWLAALPILAAILIWLWFWRNKQLVKRVMELPSPVSADVGNASDSTNLSQIQVIPSTHKSSGRSSKNIFLVVNEDDLPPNYEEAVMQVKVLKSNENAEAQAQAQTS